MSDEKPLIAFCLGCDQHKTLDQFRVYSVTPLLYIDFCEQCEQRAGTEFLYSKYRPLISDEMYRKIIKAAAKPASGRTVEEARSLIVPEKKPLPRVSEDDRIDAELRREMALREQARRHLIPFVKRFSPNYDAGWVHHDIAARLERFVRNVEQKKSPRLMLCIPFRHGKSTLASENLPAWVLGKHPEWEFIATSYAISLQLEFSRKIKDCIASDAYSSIFPDTKLRADARAADAWKTTKRGGYVAAGVGGGINGKGANILLIDDPFADKAEAQSETIRNNVWGWFTTVAQSRLTPGGGILIINTRWHDDDLSGRALTKKQELLEAGVPLEEIDDWEVISYPAIAEHDEYLFADGSIQHDPIEVPEDARLLRRSGEALHPSRYSVQELMRKKNLMVPADWNANYQQNPVPDDGEFFKRSNVNLYDRIPVEQLRTNTLILAGDLALGERQQNDWSVLGLLALNYDNHLQLVHFERGRWQTTEIIKRIVDMVRQYKPHKLGLERTHQVLAIMPLLKAALIKEKLLVSIDEDLVPISDKQARARPLQGRSELGLFGVTREAAWGEIVINEMIRFPNAKHDDIVDMLAWGDQMAQKMKPPRRPKRTDLVKKHGWESQLKISSGKKNYMAA